jgi:glycosyltransferase involved in cell wall biosynthesis
MSVEYGIGYYGVYAPFRVYESYAHMHYVQGTLKDDNGRYFDAVIPNYFEPEDFPFKSKKDDFYLFVGRMVKRKGADIAAEIVKQVGGKLVMVGQGVKENANGRIVADEITIEGDHVLHLGHADAKMRGDLMSRAKAVFLMSGYLEPFGGTSIEPMFCGTPVITTDWGAFPENIIHGKVGYRARTIGEGVWAVKNLDKLVSAKEIRKYAIDNFSTKRVKDLYQAYFEQLYTLWDDNGWYSLWDKGVGKYKRYNKYYPN